MEILNARIVKRIQSELTNNLMKENYTLASKNISDIFNELYANIPDSKRLSYGRIHVIKVLSEYLYSHLSEMKAPVFEVSSKLFKKGNDYKSKGVALGLLSFYGLNDFAKVLPYFELAATSPYFDERELAQMFFRKLIKKHHDEAREYLLQLTRSENDKLRRFVAETLRPVRESKWFYKNPEYPISILKNMFKESAPYPRTSVGNNLSDLAKQHPQLVYNLVKDLVESGDKNSYWIAYRACRNLVKKEPIKVMDLLKVDEYKYKKRVYKRSDYKRD
jgi:3-methyladenine DNA glycosylase AlkC